MASQNTALNIFISNRRCTHQSGTSMTFSVDRVLAGSLSSTGRIMVTLFTSLFKAKSNEVYTASGAVVCL